MTSDANLDRLVNSVLLPGFTGTSVPAWLKRAAEQGLAGVVYFAGNVRDLDQVGALSEALHSCRADLLTASDEEGGSVTRLEARHGSSFPGNAALGRLDSTATTAAVARALGRQLRLAGVDLGLAPVVDVNANPDNPVIGVRSFGSDPDLVARHARAFVTGLQGAGVAGCAKHFPGHGDTAVDSHLGLPVVDADLETLRQRDLPPFAAAVDAGVRCVMTAHLRCPALDDRPATISPTVLRLLREGLGFDGVIVTDALVMNAISQTVGMAAGAVLALTAGADLICISNPDDDEHDYQLVHAAVAAALRDGTLATHRVEEAAARVQQLATWGAAARTSPLPEPAPDIGLDVARQALQAVGSVRLSGPPHVVDLRHRANQAAGRYAPHLLDELRHRAPGTTSAAVDWDAAPNGSTLADGAGRPVVLLVDDPHLDPAQAGLLRRLVAERPDAVVVDSGWPRSSTASGPNVVHSFGAGRANAQAVAELLLGARGASS